MMARAFSVPKNTFDKIDVSILVGNTLDHFDSALYGFLAPLLAPLFFPDADPVIQLIMAYSVLGTSLVTRPLGAFVFGQIARNCGPLTGLSYSLIGAAVATMAFGWLPTHGEIGAWATVFLIVLRLVRGIFSAGECAIAKLYIIDGKKGPMALRASYVYPITSILGMVLASAVSTIVFGLPDQPELWRLCFIASGITGVVGYLIRLWGKAQRSKEHIFEEFQMASLRLLWIHRLAVVRVALTTGLSHITSAIPFVLMNTLMPLVNSGIGIGDMMAYNTALLILDLALIPLFGRWMEGRNVRRMMMVSCALLGATAPFVLALLEGASLATITAARAWIVVLGVLFLCPQHLYYQSLFKGQTADKYFVVGMANALGAATIGRLTPALCLWLWHTTHALVSIGLYVSLVAFATLGVMSVKNLGGGVRL